MINEVRDLILLCLFLFVYLPFYSFAYEFVLVIILAKMRYKLVLSLVVNLIFCVVSLFLYAKGVSLDFLYSIILLWLILPLVIYFYYNKSMKINRVFFWVIIGVSVVFVSYNLIQPGANARTILNKKEHFHRYPLYSLSYVSRFKDSCFLYSTLYKGYSVFCFDADQSTMHMYSRSYPYLDTNFKITHETTDKKLNLNEFEISLNSSRRLNAVQFKMSGNLHTGLFELVRYNEYVKDSILCLESLKNHIKDKNFVEKLMILDFKNLGSIDVDQLFLDPEYLTVYVNISGVTYKSRMIYSKHRNAKFDDLYQLVKARLNSDENVFKK